MDQLHLDHIYTNGEAQISLYRQPFSPTVIEILSSPIPLHQRLVYWVEEE